MNWELLQDAMWTTSYRGILYYVIWSPYPLSHAALWREESYREIRRFSGPKSACLAQIEIWKLTLPEILMEETL